MPRTNSYSHFCHFLQVSPSFSLPLFSNCLALWSSPFFGLHFLTFVSPVPFVFQAFPFLSISPHPFVVSLLCFSAMRPRRRSLAKSSQSQGQYASVQSTILITVTRQHILLRMLTIIWTNRLANYVCSYFCKIPDLYLWFMFARSALL